MTCSSYKFSSLALLSPSLGTSQCKVFMHEKEDGNAALSLRDALPNDIGHAWVSWLGVSLSGCRILPKEQQDSQGSDRDHMK